ncbi:DUF2945 domain-containing protein [Roseobacter denitrificans]|uniref:Hypervirulence associated protein TUDOR domain-containing protein n=1 Tax=Roseobacter denitrificans (strain ATCC 33942 / OCh 114) TaxID=375451 RepID=Q166R0_ROSDO|nr:DUF2945 domain-containing protein [Roseobacter denitrificans]ABG32033.1 conserved hypothetical protein [Roseobacter denitrificans OCh 114]AVL51559.1 DUF2945 domain-containing protein [Roseobacter denitrificans]SFG36596.1 Protein of unknown function [Roseobacter denitrificans OCh 114]
MSKISVGDNVQWNWGNGKGRGKVTKRFTEDVTQTIKGSDVTRKADADCPAFLIEQEDGDEVLKSASEVEKS